MNGQFRKEKDTNKSKKLELVIENNVGH